MISTHCSTNGAPNIQVQPRSPSQSLTGEDRRSLTVLAGTYLCSIKGCLYLKCPEPIILQGTAHCRLGLEHVRSAKERHCRAATAKRGEHATMRVLRNEGRSKREAEKSSASIAYYSMLSFHAFPEPTEGPKKPNDRPARYEVYHNSDHQQGPVATSREANGAGVDPEDEDCACSNTSVKRPNKQRKKPGRHEYFVELRRLITRVVGHNLRWWSVPAQRAYKWFMGSASIGRRYRVARWSKVLACRASCKLYLKLVVGLMR